MSQKKKNPVATVCSLLGTILLIVLILGCIPLTVPKAFGYNIYTVISGSMEPAIPVGSLVYVKYQEPETIQKKDVIAFYGAKDASSIVTHRVVTNKKLSGEFITKGDANQGNNGTGNATGVTQNNDGDTTTAGDEDVPQGLVDLDDEDTPKSNISVNNEKNSSTPIYAGIAISLAAIVGIIVAFMTIRKKRV